MGRIGNLMIISLALLIFPNSAMCGNYSRVDEGEGAILRAPGKSGAPSQPMMRLTDRLHGQFMESGEYALADGLLNATWDLLKRNLPESEYREALAAQREWVRHGRDAEAMKRMKGMGPAEAYAGVIRERAEYLASLISVEPRAGVYANDDGSFLARLGAGKVEVEGNSSNGADHLCEYDGAGEAGKGWIVMSHGEMPDFYLLFTKRGATIYYNTSEIDQGCGIGAGFSGSYRYRGK